MVKNRVKVKGKKALELDFVDQEITSFGGEWFLARLAEYFGIPEKIRSRLKVKRRNRGASDEAMVIFP